MKNKILNYINTMYYAFVTMISRNSVNRYKGTSKIASCATGKILPASQHPSLHVKNLLTNAKFNILLTDGVVYAPFDCEIIDVSDDCSTFILQTYSSFHYAIYLDQSSNFIIENLSYLKKLKGQKFNAFDKILTVDIDDVYMNGFLPILSFCIFEDFEYIKVFYGNTVACSRTALIYY